MASIGLLVIAVGALMIYAGLHGSAGLSIDPSGVKTVVLQARPSDAAGGNV